MRISQRRAAEKHADFLFELAPSPQLLPNLHENLDLSGTWKSVVNQPAIAVGSLVKVPHCARAEVREIVTEFLQFLLAQYLRFSAIRTSSHGQRIVSYSLCVRYKI
jgi:hypothetical protein